MRLSFIESEETDSKTRFVKRFGSRHSKNIFLKPTIHVLFDDVIHDDHSTFIFDVSGSLFLSNYSRNNLSNILSGTDMIPLTGEDCLKLTISTGSFSKTVSVSTYTGSTSNQGITGLYYTEFILPYADSSLVIESSSVKDFAVKSGSLTFTEIWHSNDGSLGFYTGSLTVTSPVRTALSETPKNPAIRVTNLMSDYNPDDIAVVRIFGYDTINVQNRPAKTYRNITSEIYEEIYYRVLDSDTGKVVIPFTKTANATRCSTDSDGMFFNFKMNTLYPGRVYHFEFQIVDSGLDIQLRQKSPMFRVNIR